MEGNFTGGHHESPRRCGGSSSGSGTVTRARKQKEEQELKRHRQLKEMKAVVVLKRLRTEEPEDLLDEREKLDIQPTKSALQILPPEILEMILDNLEDPTDLQNCSRADPVLSNVLTPRKPVYLFNQVLPHLLEYLTFDDMKSCRLVCQEWKRGVNQVIDNRPSVVPYDDKIFLEQMGNRRTRLNFGITAHSRLQPVTRIRMDIASLEEFSASYNSLSFAGRSPFVGGALELVAPERGDHFQNENRAGVLLFWYTGVLQNFLRQFQPHIHHLSIKTPPMPSPIQRRFSEMTLLHIYFCSNLQTLSIQISYAWNLMHLHPLFGRPLAHLHTIEISSTAGIHIPLYFIDAVVSPHLSQLQKLSLPPSATPTWLSLQTGRLFLKELQFAMVLSNADLERLGTDNYPVKKLIFTFGFPGLNLTTLLETLNQFPLRHLELSWTPGVSPVIREGYLTQRALPEIPSVHSFKMTNSVDVDYSFLRSFPNLMHLYIQEQVLPGVPLDSKPSMAVMKRIASSEAVQIHKYLYGGLMNRSNVWNILPNLKVIVFERVREGDEVEKWKLSWERRPRRVQPINHPLSL